MGQIKIEVINYVPRFLNFYQKAKGKDENCLWDLWKEHYNFAAVPPGEQGEKMAREMLLRAWDKYPEVIPAIEKWTPDTEKVRSYLKKVKDLLNCTKDIALDLIYFVGAFDDNPILAPNEDGRITLCWPIEGNLGDIILVHELTHIVHTKTADLSLNWERPVASIIMSEGLAMQVSKHFFPGKPAEAYTEYARGWLEDCRNNSESIVKGILPYIEESSSEKVYQFTMGQGTTGNEREAYFVGWMLVDELLQEGMSFEEIARIKEADFPEVIRRVFE